ncbi:MAG: sigma 54-interacting transcriptional regulator [Polyangiaceae bacterium]
MSGAYTRWGAQFVKTGSLIEAANRGTSSTRSEISIPPFNRSSPRCSRTSGSDASATRRERLVDVRVIAATHHDLARAVREKSFRSDLYYRLSTITISVPLAGLPLRLSCPRAREHFGGPRRRRVA